MNSEKPDHYENRLSWASCCFCRGAQEADMGWLQRVRQTAREALSLVPF